MVENKNQENQNNQNTQSTQENQSTQNTQENQSTQNTQMVESKPNQNNQKDDFKSHTNEFTKEQIQNGKVMSLLSYLSVLVLIPYFSEKNNPYVKFHAKQGINIFIYEAIFAAADAFISPFSAFFGFIIYVGSIALAVCSIIGLVFALTDEAKEIPFLDKISIVK